MATRLTTRTVMYLVRWERDADGAVAYVEDSYGCKEGTFKQPAQ